LEHSEYVKDCNGVGICTKDAYEKQLQRETLRTTCRGGNGRTVYIEYESIPKQYQKLFIEQYGDPYEYASLQPLRDLLKRPDVKAIDFFNTYEKPNGDLLDDHLKKEYVKAAAVMRMIDYVYEHKKWLKKDLKIELTRFWDVVGAMPETKAAGLPTTARKLRPRYDKWKAESYKGLIKGNIGNTNRLKRTEDIEHLILSLYADQNKPYACDIYDYYKKFLAGEVHLVDEDGEIFSPDDYTTEVGKTTVWNIINKPWNRVAVDRMRMSDKEFNDTHRPHVMRKAPVYAFSKLTMDDIAIPFIMPDGDRVWSYQIWDVASGCVVGYAFGRNQRDPKTGKTISGKNRGLFTEAIKNLFRLIVNNGWKMPYEIEVEQHISSTFKGSVNEAGEFVADILSDGYLFPFVRWCLGANPQEKRAEGFVKGKRYKIQNKREGFQRRPFAKLEANRQNEDVKKITYTFEQVVANEMADINEWNHSPHPKYEGLTRWQVLQQNQNPDLVRPHMPTLAKYIGLQTPTSVNRTFVTVQYGKYVVSDEDLSRLNSTIVTAYHIPDNNRQIPEIYLYQGDKYICTALKMGAFNEAKAEQTDEDIHLMHKQQGHIGSFDAAVKKRVQSLRKIKVIETEQVATPSIVTEPKEYTVEMPQIHEAVVFDADYWTEKALEDL